MGKMAQYTTVDSVVQAYDEAEIESFAIFHDRQLISKRLGGTLGANSGFLEEKLKGLQKTGTWGIYTLCLYEDLPPNGKITSNTPPDESFNFQLNKGEGKGAATMGAVSGGYTQEQMELAVENALLKKELEEIRRAGEVEQTDQGALMGAVDKILGIPGVPELLGAIAGRASEFVANLGRRDPGGPGGPVDESGIGMRRVMGLPWDEAERMKVEESLSELNKILPDLPELLDKLVRLSKNKFQWNFFLAGLRGMKV